MAVSGLARAFAYYKPSARYIAGLWDEDLVYGLQWSVVDSRALYPYPREGLGQYFGSTSYQAPSWSWAAHRFQVRYPGAYPSPTDAYRANIRDCTVEHISADIFGGISNAELTIDARMITDSLVGLSGRPRPWKLKELERSTRGHVQVALDFMDKDDWMQPMVRYIFQTRFPGFSETMSRVPPTIRCMLLHLRLSSSVPYGSIMGIKDKFAHGLSCCYYGIVHILENSRDLVAHGQTMKKQLKIYGDFLRTSLQRPLSLSKWPINNKQSVMSHSSRVVPHSRKHECVHAWVNHIIS